MEMRAQPINGERVMGMMVQPITIRVYSNNSVRSLHPQPGSREMMEGAQLIFCFYSDPRLWEVSSVRPGNTLGDRHMQGCISMVLLSLVELVTNHHIS